MEVHIFLYLLLHQKEFLQVLNQPRADPINPLIFLTFRLVLSKSDIVLSIAANFSTLLKGMTDWPMCTSLPLYRCIFQSWFRYWNIFFILFFFGFISFSFPCLFFLFVCFFFNSTPVPLPACRFPLPTTLAFPCYQFLLYIVLF